MHIRKSKTRDRHAILRIARKFASAIRLEDKRGMLEEHIGTTKVVVACNDEDRPLGFVYAYMRGKGHSLYNSGREHLYVSALCVDPAHHKKGVATALLNELVASNSHRRIRGSIALPNAGGTKLYAKCGFREDTTSLAFVREADAAADMVTTASRHLRPLEVTAEKIESFWVVEYPRGESVWEDLVWEATPERILLQGRGGLQGKDVQGFYLDKAEAERVAQDLLAAQGRTASTPPRETPRDPQGRPETGGSPLSRGLDRLQAKIAVIGRKTASEASVKKTAMDFSGISQLLEPGKKFSNEELARAARLALAAEEDAASLYDLIGDAVDDAAVSELFHDVANEEKVHVGEFQAVLNRVAPNEKEKVGDGVAEAEDKLQGVPESTVPPAEAAASRKTADKGVMNIHEDVEISGFFDYDVDGQSYEVEYKANLYFGDSARSMDDVVEISSSDMPENVLEDNREALEDKALDIAAEEYWERKGQPKTESIKTAEISPDIPEGVDVAADPTSMVQTVKDVPHNVVELEAAQPDVTVFANPAEEAVKPVETPEQEPEMTPETPEEGIAGETVPEVDTQADTPRNVSERDDSEEQPAPEKEEGEDKREKPEVDPEAMERAKDLLKKKKRERDEEERLKSETPQGEHTVSDSEPGARPMHDAADDARDGTTHHGARKDAATSDFVETLWNLASTDGKFISFNDDSKQIIRDMHSAGKSAQETYRILKSKGHISDIFAQGSKKTREAVLAAFSGGTHATHLNTKRESLDEALGLTASVEKAGGRWSQNKMEAFLAEKNEKDGTAFELGGSYGNWELWANGNRLEAGSFDDVYQAWIANRFKEKYRRETPSAQPPPKTEGSRYSRSILKEKKGEIEFLPEGEGVEISPAGTLAFRTHPKRAASEIPSHLDIHRERVENSISGVSAFAHDVDAMQDPDLQAALGADDENTDK